MPAALSKLNKQHIIIIGCVLIALVAGASYFLLLKPKMVSIAKLTKDLNDTNVIVQKRPQSEKALQDAKNNVAVVQAKWDQYAVQLKTVTFTEANDYNAMVQLWNEYRESLGPEFERFVRSLGVRFAGISLPAPAMTPPPIPSDGFIAIPPTGTLSISIEGDFRTIINALRKMQDFNRLVTIGEPSISGESPFLKATFPICFYLLAKVPPGLAPAAPAAAGPGGMPGGPGGMPGGGPPGIPPSGVGGTPPPGVGDGAKGTAGGIAAPAKKASSKDSGE